MRPPFQEIHDRCQCNWSSLCEWITIGSRRKRWESNSMQAQAVALLYCCFTVQLSSLLSHCCRVQQLRDTLSEASYHQHCCNADCNEPLAQQFEDCNAQHTNQYSHISTSVSCAIPPLVLLLHFTVSQITIIALTFSRSATCSGKLP